MVELVDVARLCGGPIHGLKHCSGARSAIYHCAKPTHYDLVLLGSGSTAFAAALRAQELGKTSVMAEERMAGGTCVNRGCLPSKNLIEAAKVIHDARHPRYPGLTPAELGLDFRKLIERKDEIIHDYRHKKLESLTGGQFTIENGHGEFVADGVRGILPP